ncbi:MAG: hypothetical protein MZV49_20435 [Rhodopseudomonas palustris]|nr:hypothetical protein [Rhodopseudomonas palustris]
MLKRTFRTGLAIGLAVATAIAAAAITYERYDTKTLERTIRRDAVLCGVNTGLPGFSIARRRRATGPASTSMCAARWRRRSSTIRAR